MLSQGPFQACDSDPCYSDGSLASDISRSDVLSATNRMPSSFRGQPNLFNLPKQNSPLAILHSSASNSTSPKVTRCLSCDLWAPWVSTQALPSQRLPNFCRAPGETRLLDVHPSRAPSAFQAAEWWDLTPPAPGLEGGGRGHWEAWHPVLLRTSNTEAPLHNELGRNETLGAQRDRYVNGGNKPTPVWAWELLTPPKDGQGNFLSWRMGVQGWHSASSGQEPACSSATWQMGTEFEREGK